MINVFVFFLAVLLGPPSGNRITNEADYLRETFSEQVGSISVTEEYREIVFSKVSTTMEESGVICSPQYLLFVDRNPSVQLVTLLFVNPDGKHMTVIGTDKVSTGNPARRGYFVTPLGFLKNFPGNMSYRALGTKNSKGWRGLGTKGSRVWDFGWVETHTKKGEPYKIRLLMHATDPNYGEIRLGQVGSKGCIRISKKLNHFLDYFGILDAEYERSESKRVRDVLLPAREPVCFAGRFVLVGDSSEATSEK